MKKKSFSFNKSLTTKISAIFILLLVTITAKAQLPGNWNPAPQTTTYNALGVGTTTPEGWEEIRYCDENQIGLIVTNTLCGPSANPKIHAITFDGRHEPSFGSVSSTTIPYPIADFNLRPYRAFTTNNHPMIWARIENHPTQIYASSGGFSSRFIVTPAGTAGVNIEVPRATLDIKSLGKYNYPGLIVGRQQVGSNNRTQHVMFVPLVDVDAYNKISQQNDQGLFFTDGKGTDGANLDGSFVIAPWANQGDPTVGGIRIDKFGNLETHATIKATKLNLETKWWSDFVFEPQYNRMSLADLEKFISQNHHLPGIPSECEVMEKGLDVADMQALHMQKIEELTLYTIDQEKKIAQQQQTIIKYEHKQAEQDKQLQKLQEEVKLLTTQLELLFKNK